MTGHVHGAGTVAVDAYRIRGEFDGVAADDRHAPALDELDQPVCGMFRVVGHGSRLSAGHEETVGLVAAIGEDLRVDLDTRVSSGDLELRS